MAKPSRCLNLKSQTMQNCSQDRFGKRTIYTPIMLQFQYLLNKIEKSENALKSYLLKWLTQNETI